MSAPYARVRSNTHQTAHLAAPGSLAALCGVFARNGEWAEADSLPDCGRCAAAARVAAAVANWNAPHPRPGILAMVVRSQSDRTGVGECARCGQVRMLRQRGLCQGCARTATLDGSIGDYGSTREDRLAEFAGLRRGGLSIRQASARLGVSGRTGDRYEETLAASGRATWRSGVPYSKQAQRELTRTA